MQGLGFRVQGLGLGFRVWGLGFWGLGAPKPQPLTLIIPQRHLEIRVAISGVPLRLLESSVLRCK